MYHIFISTIFGHKIHYTIVLHGAFGNPSYYFIS